MIHDPWLSTLRALGRDAEQLMVANAVPVPLSKTPEKGLVPQMTAVPHMLLGWVIKPEPLMMPRLKVRVSDSRRVPLTRMLSWFCWYPGVLYGNLPIRPVPPPV